LEVCGAQGDDYNGLWCYCPHDGNFLTRVCIVIHKLKEQGKELEHTALGSIWRLYSRYQKPSHEMNHLRIGMKRIMLAILTDAVGKKDTEEEE
jgi:hypothetical protein